MRAYYAANRTKLNAKTREYGKEYYIANKARINARNNANYSKTREKVSARLKEYNRRPEVKAAK